MIYLDNAATTKPDPRALVNFAKYSIDYPYNPSSIYEGGIRAKNALLDARKRIARKCGVEYDEIFFTSGGTEGNNMILKGFFSKLPKNEIGVLIVSQLEHPSVLKVAEYFEQNYNRNQIRVYYIPYDVKTDNLDYESLETTIKSEIDDGINPENILVSVQSANNEIGSLFDVDYINSIVQKYGCFFHSDMVQYFPHYPDVVRCDAATVSGHKFHALRGTGFVVIKKRLQKHIAPLLLGGNQEYGFRAGTENVAGFCVLADMVDNLYAVDWRARDLVTSKRYNQINYMFTEIDKRRIERYVNGNHSIPVWNVTFPGVDASSLISLLSEKGIYISAGSACHSYQSEPSHVLKAIGLSDEYAKSTVRICWNPEVTDKEWMYFVEQLIFYIELLKGV